MFLFSQMHSYGRNSEIPLGFFGLAFPAGCSGVAQGTVTRPERVSVWWGFPGGFLRLPRASRSDNFVIALTCVKAWVGQ